MMKMAILAQDMMKDMEVLDKTFNQKAYDRLKAKNREYALLVTANMIFVPEEFSKLAWGVSRSATEILNRYC